MNDYILLMYDDASDRVAANDDEAWSKYIIALRQSERFDGGSSIGAGVRLKKGTAEVAVSAGLTGFICVRAESIEEAKRFLVGNPVYESGGTVVLHELPRE